MSIMMGLYRSVVICEVCLLGKKVKLKKQVYFVIVSVVIYGSKYQSLNPCKEVMSAFIYSRAFRNPSELKTPQLFKLLHLLDAAFQNLVLCWFVFITDNSNSGHWALQFLQIPLSNL